MIDLINPSWELRLENIKLKHENHVIDVDDIQFLLDLIEELKQQNENLIDNLKVIAEI